jgi:hypothetical protein
VTTPDPTTDGLRADGSIGSNKPPPQDVPSKSISNVSDEEADRLDAECGPEIRALINDEPPPDPKSPRIIAGKYYGRGWMPVRIAFKSKRPTAEEWQKIKGSATYIDSAFSQEPCNIGVRLGSASGGLIDIDLDCPEATALAAAVLPPTDAIFGRKSAPRSHWLYSVASGEAFTQYKDLDGPMLVELRGDGVHQSVFPGSVHESGESIDWDSPGEPPPVALDVLQQRVALLAALSLIARHWPAQGSRHDAANALAGGLFNAGVDPNEIPGLVRRVAAIGGDDGTDADAHEKTAKGTVEKAQRDEKATGWPTLAKLIGDAVVDRAMDWLSVPRGCGVVRKNGNQPTHAQLLVDLAQREGVQLFHHAGEAYGAFPVNGHAETYKLPSRAARLWLNHAFFNLARRIPGIQAVQDATHTLTAMALHDGQAEPVGVRVMGTDSVIWLDLCDDTWRAVRIDAEGWRIVDEPPVRFIRYRGMQPLPAPERGGSIEELRPFVNATDDDDFTLMVAWLVGALRPSGPYAVLGLNGEQGSAKSFTSRTLRALVDPNFAALRSEPRNPHDLFIAANNAWVLAYDNISRLPPWLSDSFCRLATGGGFGTREFYTDDSERLFDGQRPILLNGITDYVGRPDLLERSIMLTLPSMPEDKRRAEADLLREFEAACPRILGALLDAVSAAIRNLPGVQLSQLPRMADFAKWIVAAEPGLGWTPGRFVRAYDCNRQGATETAIEQSTIGPALLAVMESRDQWIGTATELLRELEAVSCVSETEQRQRGWPKRANALSSHLRRLAPDLRRVGIVVVFPQRRAKVRNIVLVRQRYLGSSFEWVGADGCPGVTVRRPFDEC